MRAELDNADEDALVYLAGVLSYLATWGLSVVCITVKNRCRNALPQDSSCSAMIKGVGYTRQNDHISRHEEL